MTTINKYLFGLISIILCGITVLIIFQLFFWEAIQLYFGINIPIFTLFVFPVIEIIDKQLSKVKLMGIRGLLQFFIYNSIGLVIAHLLWIAGIDFYFGESLYYVGLAHATVFFIFIIGAGLFRHC